MEDLRAKDGIVDKAGNYIVTAEEMGARAV